MKVKSEWNGVYLLWNHIKIMWTYCNR